MTNKKNMAGIKKKIFFLADAQQIHTAKWVDYFVEQGYDVHLATFAQNRTKAQNVYYLSKQEKNLKGGNFYYLLSIKKIADLLKEIQPDVINAHFSYSMGMMALIASKIAKVDSTFSVVCHGTDVLIPPHPMITTHINKYVLRHTDKIFAVSSQIRDKILSFGVNEDNIFTGQYGIDVTCENLDRDIDILSNRTYEPNSRIDMMLDYLQELDDMKLNIVFVLPDVTDDEYYTLVKKYKNVTFYKPIPYSELLNLVNRSKIYVSATKSDGTSLSLMEAMSLKCIPLVSDIVSNRSLILDGVNGFLFYTKEHFLDRIRYIVENYDELSAVIPKINEKVIEKDGSYQIQMEKMDKFLELKA